MAIRPFYDDSGEPYGSCEVLYLDGSDILADQDEGAAPLPRGWYWWPCFPGCLPDGEIGGPFPPELEAMEDAGCVPPTEREEG